MIEITDVEDVIRKYIALKVYSKFSAAKEILNKDTLDAMIQEMEQKFEDQMYFVNMEITNMEVELEDSIDNYLMEV